MLSKTTILDWITAHEPDLLQFTRDLVATPSVNPPGDERAVAERIDDELGKLGLGKAQIIAAEPHRPNILHQVAATGPGPTLVFCGHMDTKPAGNRQQWKHDPLDPVVDGDKLYGLGSSDMKSGIAAMVYAVAGLQATGSLQAGQLHLLFTADEEAGSHLGSKFLAANGHVQGDAILISESCGVHRELEFIALDGRGAALFSFRVYGDQMHSSLSDEFNAVNASVKAAELLTRFDREFKIPGATLNAGAVLKGGVFFGVVPGMAEFGCDLRVPPGHSQQGVRAKVEQWLEKQKQKDPQLRVELLWETPPLGWAEPVSFPRDHPLAIALQDACRCVLTDSPPFACYPAGTDAPWFIEAGVPTIPAFGPGLLPLAHSPNEFVQISSIYACARIYALAANQYLVEPAT